MKPQRYGWVGIVDGEPYAEAIIDDYTGPNERGARVVSIYLNRAQAKRRFEVVQRVLLDPESIVTTKPRKRKARKHG